MILLQIVCGLDRKRFTPIVVLPDDMKHVGLLSAELTLNGIEWRHLPIAIVRRRYLKLVGIPSFASKLLHGTLALRRFTRERNVQLIHGFTLAVAAAPLASLATGIPLVMHAHEIIERPRFLRKLLHALSLFRSSRLLCVSEAVRGNVIKDQPSAASRVQVIRNGIQPVSPPDKSISELRSELGVPIDKPLVGMIGRVSPWKGQQIFLEAAALVLKTHPDCHFIAIGGVFDNETQHLDQLIETQSRLRLHDAFTIAGFSKEARTMIAAFDLYVLPSTRPDPFPTVLLEAMSLGVPIIATAHGGPLEMVVEGVTGLLIPPSDPEALADGIRSLMSMPDRGQSMGETGRARASSLFGIQRYLELIQTVYSEILEKKFSKISS